MTKEALCWWTKISGAKTLLEKTVSRLLEERHTAIHHGTSQTWEEEFRENVMQQVQEESGLRCFLPLNIKETGPDIGKYLFEHYCPEERQNRFALKEGYARFIAAECGPSIGDYYIWIYGIDKKAEDDKIMDFIAEYSDSPSKYEKAVFIVESSYKGKKKGRKNIGVLEQESKITQYDMALYAMELLNDSRLKGDTRQYIAELAANIGGTDPKVCVSCIEHAKEILKDPENGILQAIADAGTAVIQDKEKLRKQIWEAQIRVFYPTVETERLELVNKYRKQIERQLPARMPFGEIVNEADMAELGMLKSMKDTAKLIVDPDDAKRIDTLWSIRNALAHLKILEDVSALSGNRGL